MRKMYSADFWDILSFSLVEGRYEADANGWREPVEGVRLMYSVNPGSIYTTYYVTRVWLLRKEEQYTKNRDEFTQTSNAHGEFEWLLERITKQVERRWLNGCFV